MSATSSPVFVNIAKFPRTKLLQKHNYHISTPLLFPHQRHRGSPLSLQSASRRELLLWSTSIASTRLDAQQQTYTQNTTTTRIIPDLETEIDVNGKERVKLRPDGYNSYAWRSHTVNWLSAGEDNAHGPIVVLIHGFGASSYHYRYLVPMLAKANCRVYALDSLGFGWSDKALVEYDGYSVWSEQISDFIRDVIHTRTKSKEKVVLVGNSLGGYNSMATAAGYPELVRGIVLLNAAGRFDTSTSSQLENVDVQHQSASFLQAAADAILTVVKRLVVSASFLFTKQPARVRHVLNQVYKDGTNIDDDLVKSILLPADDPNAGEVFYRIITGRGKPMNVLLDEMKKVKMPVFLLWGKYDPWCVPARADQIQRYYPIAERVDVDGGHCVHDEIPDVVSKEMLKWMSKL